MKTKEIKTVMHSIKVRTLQVKRVKDISPSLRRITLSGKDLAGFTSLSADDHIKVFFAADGGRLLQKPPSVGPKGLEFHGEERPLMRDYTPRRYDEKTNELDIDFFLHEAGAGSEWAKHATVGDSLSFAGPRGSKIVPFKYDWYLMIGDEAAIPSFARRLEELPADAKAILLIEVEDEKHQIDFQSPETVTVKWIYRKNTVAGDPNRFIYALEDIEFFNGDFFTWVSTEKKSAKAIEAYLVSERSVSLALLGSYRQPRFFETA